MCVCYQEKYTRSQNRSIFLSAVSAVIQKTRHSDYLWFDWISFDSRTSYLLEISKTNTDCFTL